MTAAAPAGSPLPIDLTRLGAARLRAADAYPYLALALFALTPVSAPNLGTLAVDARWRLYVDPDQLHAWTVPECAGVLLHEVGHLVRDHAGRARLASVDARSLRRWNIAADVEINDDLRSDSIALPENGVFPETIGEPPGKAAEYYFARLLQVADEDLPDIPDCGSGCHGVGERDAGTGPGDDPTGGEGLDAVEVMLMRRRVADAVRAWAQGPQPGDGHAGWVRWADAVLEPRLDWRRLLHGSVRRAVGAVSGAADYSYRRPARRRVPGVVLPNLVRPLPRAAIVVDTSGSVDEVMLNAAWTEVRACLRSLGVRRDLLTVYAADVAAEKVSGVGTHVGLTGGGGTDMAAAIAAVDRQRPRPDVLVVITDGSTPWPTSPPSMRVVVALLADPGDWRPPAWAQVVRVDDPPAGC
jgi:predicted metal-dependent peptidase